LEENRKLKKKLKKAGYIIKDSFTNPSEWVAETYIDKNKITIVDCSYEEMDRMKYRKKLNGKWEDIWDYRRMEDFELNDVLKAVGDIELMYKNLLIEQKLQKIKDMCGDD
jgi:Zn-finger domain-containing protein